MRGQSSLFQNSIVLFGCWCISFCECLVANRSFVIKTMKLGMPAKAFFLIVLVCTPLQIAAGNLQYGHASFYSGGGGSETVGVSGARVSTMLFNGGSACGACYEIWCNDKPGRCKPGSIVSTVTNICTPNYTFKKNWCNTPENHFLLPESDFRKIAYYDDEFVNVTFRRVPCAKMGGIEFKIMGRPRFTRVLITNVAGAGDIIAVSIKGSRTDWQPMSRDWCQSWKSNSSLGGQSLSFKVTTSDHRTLTLSDVAPDNWQSGETYTGHINFSL